MPKLIMSTDNGSGAEINVPEGFIVDGGLQADTQPVETEVKKEEAPKETLEHLETLAEKTDDAIPLKKYMAEKNAKREAESKVAELQAELEKARNAPKSETPASVRAISEQYDISEDVLNAILNASYTMTKDKVREELEAEFSPKLAEFETIKQEKTKHEFETKFNDALTDTLNDMPEYKDLVDTDDLKTWVKSGKYSKLNLPQLIEQKYGKFVQGKKTIEQGYSAKEVDVVDVSNMTDNDYMKLDSDPALKEKWAKNLPDRLRSIL